MSDVKDALSVLCKYISTIINVALTPEHFRSAKYNAADKNVNRMLWNTLRALSCLAAKVKGNVDLDLRDYDMPLTVKLNFAYLQYPTIEFYALSEDNNHNRDLLIALAWLIATENVLTTALKEKLIGSLLGSECSVATLPKFESPLLHNDQPLSTNAQLNSILQLNGKVNLNLREISELTFERSKLICKVHAASINVCGLPHLNVSELSLTKRAVITEKGVYSEQDRKQLQELRDAGIMLDSHAKWLEKKHVFFNWMTTVIDEHRKCMESNQRNINSHKLIAFISLLRHVTWERLNDSTSKETTGKIEKLTLSYASRWQRNQCNNANVNKWLDELNENQMLQAKNLRRNKKQLAVELKEMLKLIPSSKLF